MPRAIAASRPSSTSSTKIAPPRPANQFLLFRKHMVPQLAAAGENLKSQGELSRRVGELWRALPPKEKSKWELEAKRVKAEHAAKHPDYMYRPQAGGRKQVAQSLPIGAPIATSKATSSAEAEPLTTTPIPTRAPVVCYSQPHGAPVVLEQPPHQRPLEWPPLVNVSPQKLEQLLALYNISVSNASMARPLEKDVVVADVAAETVVQEEVAAKHFGGLVVTAGSLNINDDLGHPTSDLDVLMTFFDFCQWEDASPSDICNNIQ